MGLFDEIRSACGEVARGAGNVRVVTDRIAAYARSLPLDKAVAPELDPRYHYVGHGEGTADFVLTLDAINFGSGYFPHLTKREGLSGYFTVAAGLTEHFNAHGPLKPAQLMELKADDCAKMFGQAENDSPAVAELMGLFAKALNDLGKLATDSFCGRLVNIIESADGSAEELTRILAKMPFYEDARLYRGRRVPFYKRAQLTAADLAISVPDEKWAKFEDLHSLTIFADNLVPHVLRVDGILEYSPQLADRIDRVDLIEMGSEEEVELRACAVHAVTLMAKSLRKVGKDVSEAGLDYVLWNRGQEKHYKTIKPRHRTRTVSY